MATDFNFGFGDSSNSFPSLGGAGDFGGGAGGGLGGFAGALGGGSAGAAGGGFLDSIGGIGGLGKIAEGIASLGSLFTGFKGLKLAKKQFKFQKSAFRSNLRDSRKAFNLSLSDRIRSRFNTEGKSEGQAADFLAKNSL